MRLVDADELPWVDKLIVLNKCDGDIIVMETKEYASYVDEDTPTVEAIPIAWLEKEAEDWEYHNELVAAVLKSIIKGRCWEEKNETNR